MAENESNFVVRKVGSAQNYIKQKYSETIGLATSILGQVLLGTIKGSKRKKEVIKLCLKDMRKQFSDRVAENPRMEIEFMRQICNKGHPNFVGYLDAVEDSKLYCICLEYVKGGDMCTYIQNLRSGISHERAKKYSIQLTKAVYFMHCNGYCHLDISLENVLWDKKNDNVKLCDFGLCRKFPNNDINEQFESASIRPGKKGYMAPEIYAYQRFNGEKADVFSLGVLIFILLTGFPPFTTPNASDKCFQYIYYGKLEWLLKQWKLNDLIDEECTDLLSKIFCHPKKRINIKQMLQHPWFGQNMEDIDKEISSYNIDSTSTESTESETTKITPTTQNQTQSPSQSEAQSKSTGNTVDIKEQSPSPTASSSSSSSTTTTGTKKRKSIIIKKKRLSKSKKQQISNSSEEKKKSEIRIKKKTINYDLSKSKKVSTYTKKTRPKSKSITHIFGDLSIHESQTLLSEFEAIVDNDNNNKYNKQCFNRPRSKSFSYHHLYSINNNNKNKEINYSRNSNKKNEKKQRHSSVISNSIREETPPSQQDECKINKSKKSKKSNHNQQTEENNNLANLRENNQSDQDHNDQSSNDNEGPGSPPIYIMNDTQLITQKYKMMNDNNHNNQPHHHHANNNHNNHIVNECNDIDRKEGDYMSTERNSVISHDEERRLSVHDDAASHHSHHSHQSYHSHHGNPNNQHNINNNNHIKPDQHPYIVDDVSNNEDEEQFEPTASATMHSPV